MIKSDTVYIQGIFPKNKIQNETSTKTGNQFNNNFIETIMHYVDNNTLCNIKRLKKKKEPKNASQEKPGVIVSDEMLTGCKCVRYIRSQWPFKMFYNFLNARVGISPQKSTESPTG
jgi:hypothetical protein